MRISLVSLFLLGFGAFTSAQTLSAQTLTVQPDIALAEAAFLDAQEALRHSDPNLDADFLKVSPAEAHRRIQKEAALRNDAMEKKRAFLDLLVQRSQKIRDRAAQTGGANIPVDALKKDLEKQQAGILAEQDDLDQLIRDLPQGDEYLLVRRHLEEERAHLVTVQNLMAQRLRSMDKLGKSQDALHDASAGTSLETHLEEISKVWTEERDAAVAMQAKFAGLYAAMERAVDSRATETHAGAPDRTAPKSVPPPPKTKSAPAGTPAKTPPPVGLSGAWIYRSQPSGWTGFGEPSSVTLELRVEGVVIHGVYSASLPVKGGPHTVQLTLEGKLLSPTSATLKWKSADPPAEGDLSLKLGADGRLLLERLTSADSYIPLGSEVLSHK